MKKNHIQFTKLTLKNFMSYGNIKSELDLTDSNACIILGDNGAGKTSLIKAFTYALFDSTIEDLDSKDDLVNNINSKEQMEVSVEWNKNNTYYKVIRGRKNKKNSIFFYERKKNNKFDTKKDDITLDVANTNKLIVSKLGISFNLFIRIGIFSALNTAFLKLSSHGANSNNQIDIIEELFSLTLLSDQSDKLGLFTKELKQDFKFQEQKIEILEDNVKQHNINVKNLSDRVNKWKQQQQQKIQNTNHDLKSIENIDKKTIKEQQNIQDEVKTVDQAIRDLNNKKRNVSSESDRLTDSISTLEDEIRSLDENTCPYCKQQFENTETKLSLCNTSIQKHTKKLKMLTKDSKLLKKQIDTLSIHIEQLESKITVDDINQFIDLFNKKENMEMELDRLSNEINPYIEPLNDLKNTKVETVDYKVLDETSDDIKHQEFLRKLLSKKDSFIRKNLISKSLPLLNEKLKIYVKEMGLPFKVEFTKNMTADISKFGAKLKFNSLSHGQQARLNFSLALAFRDVLENNHCSINLFFLDELLDIGLNSEGVLLASNLIKTKTKKDQLTTFIISHREELQNNFEKTMYIKMDKGFSHIQIN